MAAKAKKQKVKIKKNGEGLMAFQKWEKHMKKKKMSEEKKKKKKRDRRRYLLKKQSCGSISSYEKRELDLLQEVLQK